MARSRGYAPFESSPGQDALLDQIIAHATTAGSNGVGVFDLDGCLFDTRPRQVKIIREYASIHDALDLYCIREEHFTDWSLATTMRNAAPRPTLLQPVAAAGKVATHSTTVFHAALCLRVLRPLCATAGMLARPTGVWHISGR